MEPTIEPTQSAADVKSDVVRPSAPLRFCLLSVGHERLAVDLSHVREVFRVESITPVPGMPSALVGVANLRGTVIPLADLRPVLGVPRSSTPKYAAVVRQGGEQVGILIDEVPEIRVLEPSDAAEGSPHEPGTNHPFLSRRLNVEGQTSGLVELSKLLAVVEGTVDRQRHECMIDGDGVDTEKRAVIPGGHRTTSDGEDNGHGKA